ncbi:MAG TPA: EamA family transporter [Mycobacteriales bacterium]|jgi:inner membrane transporter RhtA|nr:EamA family transporter [Mycobacteriales bacterium]
MPRRTAPAPLLVLAAVASVQSGAAVAKDLFPDAGPGGAVLLRIGIAAVLLLVVARPRVVSRGRAELGLAIGFGLVLAAMNATFYYAIDRIPLGVAVTFEFVGPLAVAIGGSRRLLDLVWVALAAAGVVLLTGGSGGHLDALGVALAFVAGGFWAAYILLSQRVGRVFPGAAGLTIALVAGTVVLLPVGLVSAGSRLLDGSVLWRGLVVALLSSALPYSLELYALRRLRASVFGVLMSLEPAFAAASGLLFLGEHLRVTEWVAIACVVIASVGATRRTSAEDVPIDPAATPPELVAR